MNWQAAFLIENSILLGFAVSCLTGYLAKRAGRSKQTAEQKDMLSRIEKIVDKLPNKGPGGGGSGPRIVPLDAEASARILREMGIEPGKKSDDAEVGPCAGCGEEHENPLSQDMVDRIKAAIAFRPLDKTNKPEDVWN